MNYTSAFDPDGSLAAWAAGMTGGAEAAGCGGCNEEEACPDCGGKETAAHQALSWGMQQTDDRSDPFWSAAKIAEAVRTAPGRDGGWEWGNIDKAVAFVQRAQALARQGVNAIGGMVDQLVHGLPSGVFCELSPWDDPNCAYSGIGPLLVDPLGESLGGPGSLSFELRWGRHFPAALDVVDLWLRYRANVIYGPSSVEWTEWHPIACKECPNAENVVSIWLCKCMGRERVASRRAYVVDLDQLRLRRLHWLGALGVRTRGPRDFDVEESNVIARQCIFTCASSFPPIERPPDRPEPPGKGGKPGGPGGGDPGDGHSGGKFGPDGTPLTESGDDPPVDSRDKPAPPEPPEVGPGDRSKPKFSPGGTPLTEPGTDPPVDRRGR